MQIFCKISGSYIFWGSQYEAQWDPLSYIQRVTPSPPPSPAWAQTQNCNSYWWLSVNSKAHTIHLPDNLPTNWELSLITLNIQPCFPFLNFTLLRQPSLALFFAQEHDKGYLTCLFFHSGKWKLFLNLWSVVRYFPSWELRGTPHSPPPEAVQPSLLYHRQTILFVWGCMMHTLFDLMQFL